MVFQASDPAYYTTLMQSAKDLYAAGRRNRASYTYAFNYPCADEGDKVLTPDNAQCPPADELFHGAMIGTYNSTSYRDDLAWAAAWLYKATNDSKYEHDAYRYDLANT